MRPYLNGDLDLKALRRPPSTGPELISLGHYPRWLTSRNLKDKAPYFPPGYRWLQTTQLCTLGNPTGLLSGWRRGTERRKSLGRSGPARLARASPEEPIHQQQQARRDPLLRPFGAASHRQQLQLSHKLCSSSSGGHFPLSFQWKP